jgi:hypothetical protein
MNPFPNIKRILLMKNNSSTDQLALQTVPGPSLRIAYKNEVATKKAGKRARKSKPVQTVSRPVVKEPLPMFDDYKFKAKDHDPL